MEWLRIFRQSRVFLVFNQETVGIKASISWCPGIFSIQVVDSSCNDWAGVKSDISLPLEEGDLNSIGNTCWSPNNIKRYARWDDLVAGWRSYAVEELSESRRSKSQNGGRDE